MTASIASQRFRQRDADNPWYTAFRFSPAHGLGHERGITRRDPSCIIQHEGRYFVWYTRTQPGPRPVGHARADAFLRAVPWDLADIWYATSADGHHWQEQGPAIQRGPRGSYDERSVFTPDVLAHDSRFYLVYQTTRAPSFRCTPESIAIAVAERPSGPWRKSADNVVTPDPSGRIADINDLPERAPVRGSWDSLRVHDPALLFRARQFWLYYKGEGIGHLNLDSKWGVAVAADPFGPYFKSPLNPLTNSGHEVMVWPYAGGVAGLLTRCGPEKNTIQFAPDGLNFEIKASISEPPQAMGALRVSQSENHEPLASLQWGLSHITAGSAHPIRQGRDPLALAPLVEPWDFIVRWQRDDWLKDRAHV